MSSIEPILLYGVPAGSSLGFMVALEWLRQPYRLCRVDMLGKMRHPSYARINARHETPVLITDRGEPLAETIAIASWLEARDLERRVSFERDSPQSDRIHQVMAYLNTGFTAAFGPLWAAMEMAPPEPTFQSALRRYGAASVIERHDKPEAQQDGSPFLAGARLTLADADAVFVGLARWLEIHHVADRRRWPRLDAIRTRIEADPAVQWALALENGECSAGSSPECDVRSDAYKGQLALVDVIEMYGTSAGSE